MASAEGASHTVVKPNYRLKTVCGHHDRAVSSVKFAPPFLGNPPMLASVSADASCRIWNTEGKLLTKMEGHTQGINDVCWAVGGNLVATASDDKLIKVWDVNREAEVCTLEGHENYVFCVNMNNPRGDLLVSGSFDEHVKLWDLRNPRCLNTLPAHSDPVTATDFSRDGSCVASSSHDGLIRIWDTGSGECLKTIFAEGNPAVSFVKFSPNGKFLLAGTLDSTLRLWNMSSPSKCIKSYRGHTNQRYSIFSTFSVSGGGQFIVSGSEDNALYLWDLQKKNVLQKLEGHTDAVLTVAAHNSIPLLASGGMAKDRSVRIWEHKEPTEQMQANGGPGEGREGDDADREDDGRSAAERGDYDEREAKRGRRASPTIESSSSSQQQQQQQQQQSNGVRTNGGASPPSGGSTSNYQPLQLKLQQPPPPQPQPQPPAEPQAHPRQDDKTEAEGGEVGGEGGVEKEESSTAKNGGSGGGGAGGSGGDGSSSGGGKGEREGERGGGGEGGGGSTGPNEGAR